MGEKECRHRLRSSKLSSSYAARLKPHLHHSCRSQMDSRRWITSSRLAWSTGIAHRDWKDECWASVKGGGVKERRTCDANAAGDFHISDR